MLVSAVCWYCINGSLPSPSWYTERVASADAGSPTPLSATHLYVPACLLSTDSNMRADV